MSKPPYEIEQTSKKLKAQLIAAWLLIIIGFIILIISDQSQRVEAILFFSGFELLGVAWLFITKIRIWWNNG